MDRLVVQIFEKIGEFFWTYITSVDVSSFVLLKLQNCNVILG